MHLGALLECFRLLLLFETLGDLDEDRMLQKLESRRPKNTRTRTELTRNEHNGSQRSKAKQNRSRNTQRSDALKVGVISNIEQTSADRSAGFFLVSA